MSYTATNLGFLSGGHLSVANGISGDGTVVVGGASDSTNTLQPVYWDDSNVIHQLPLLAGTVDGQAWGASFNGTIIIGTLADNTGASYAVIWTGGPSWSVALLVLPGGDSSGSAFSCSSDGTVVAGSYIAGLAVTSTPCVWVSGVFAALPLPGSANDGTASGVSPDGTVIVGFVTNRIFGPDTAVSWSGAPTWVATVLPDLGFHNAGINGASAASSAGGVIGGAVQSSVGTTSEAAIWGSSVLTIVGPDGSSIRGVDSLGVTFCGAIASGAAVWVANTPSALPTFVGGSVAAGNSISSNGAAIAGIGFDGSAHQTAVRWDAPPPPPTAMATLADLFFSVVPGFVDLTVTSNRRNFVSPNGGAQNLGPTGQRPFGVGPVVFLTSDGTPATFADNNGRGGPFVISSGTLTAGGTNPPGSTIITTTTEPFSPGQGVLGDYLTGNLYAFNPATYTDNGTQRRWLRRWRALPQATIQAVRFAWLNIVFQTGAGAPDGTNPQVVLRWSDDGGHTYSDERIVPVEPLGETSFTVKFNRLGMTRRFSGSDRIFEISSSDAFKIAILDAEVDVK